MQIDFFTTCRYRHSIFVDTQIGLQNRREVRSNIWVVPNGFEVAVTAVKELAHHSKLKEKSLKSLKLTLDQDIDFFRKALEPYLGDELTSKLQESLQKSFWQDAESLSENIRKSINRYDFESLVRRVIFWTKSFFYHLDPPLSFFVILLGPDGSGKTTIAEGIGNKLTRNPFCSYKNLHFTFEIIPQLKNLQKVLNIFPGFNFEVSLKEMPEPGTLHMGMSEPHGTLKSMIYATYYTLDFFIGNLLLKRYFGQQKLVIFDRYFYDYYFQLGYSKIPHWFLTFLKLFVPKPSLIVYLDRDANDIYAVKPELKINEILRQQKVIESKLCREDNSFIIDANKGVENTVNSIYNLIIEKLIQRVAKR